MSATLIFSIITTSLMLILVYNLFFDLINAIKGNAPNLSSTKKDTNNIKSIYNFSPKQKVTDLGAGCGHILNSLKTKDVSIDGYEINPLLYLYLKFKFRTHENINILKKDFLKANLSKYDVLIIYGSDKVMQKLED
ncbi:rRNA adenine N-6-methyltransferase family protein, partial [Patescibacteria group bacterium]